MIINYIVIITWWGNQITHCSLVYSLILYKLKILLGIGTLIFQKCVMRRLSNAIYITIVTKYNSKY